MLRIPQARQSEPAAALQRVENEVTMQMGRGKGGKISERESRRRRELVLMQYDRVGVWKDHGCEDAFFTRTKGAAMQSARKGRT